MNNRLLQEVTDRLEYHLNQVCDARACETPEHEVTRALIERARSPRVSDVEIHIDHRPNVIIPLFPSEFRMRNG